MERATKRAGRWFFSHAAQSAIRYFLGGASVLIGLSWIFGPSLRHSSAVYAVWNELGISWHLTGAWALVSGLLIVAPTPWPGVRFVGYAMGFVFRFTFAGYAGAAYLTNDNIGITGFTDWGTLAALHAVCAIAVIRDRDTPRIEDVQAAIARRADAS